VFDRWAGRDDSKDSDVMGELGRLEDQASVGIGGVSDEDPLTSVPGLDGHEALFLEHPIGHPGGSLEHYAPLASFKVHASDLLLLELAQHLSHVRGHEFDAFGVGFGFVGHEP